MLHVPNGNWKWIPHNLVIYSCLGNQLLIWEQHLSTGIISNETYEPCVIQMFCIKLNHESWPNMHFCTVHKCCHLPIAECGQLRNVSGPHTFKVVPGSAWQAAMAILKLWQLRGRPAASMSRNTASALSPCGVRSEDESAAAIRHPVIALDPAPSRCGSRAKGAEPGDESPQ